MCEFEVVISGAAVQNKLQSLKGLEGLTKLTVLNAGKNKLKSMDEVKSLASLRALILNDKKISSVCKLDRLKELNTPVNLRNLNLQGNHIAEKENLLKKVKKLLPNLHILNARPIDKIVGKEVHRKVDDFVEASNKLGFRSETKVDHSMRNKNSSKADPLIESMDNNLKNAGHLGSRNKWKELLDKKGVDSAENTNISGKRTKKKLKFQ